MPLHDMRIVELVDNLRNEWWWEKFFWKGPVRTEVVFSHRADSVGWYDKDNDAGVMDMGVSHHNVKSILHELAHVLAHAINDSHAHDPFFARTYAVLVYAVMGSQAWLTLQSRDPEKVIHELMMDYPRD